MAVKPALARQLATAFLAGWWGREELIARGKVVLAAPRKRLRWLPPLVDRILTRFGDSVPAPRWRALAEFLSADRRIQQLSADEFPHLGALALQPPPMQPAAALQECRDLPPLTTPGELAEWLGMSMRDLNWLAGTGAQRRLRLEGTSHYCYQQIRKRSGRLRLIESPKSRLKEVQQQILHGILDHLPPHGAAHAFRSGRSVATYVAPHTGHRVALHIDLQEFFPSIRMPRVQAIFRHLGYPESVADLLSRLCTNVVPAHVLRDAADQLTIPGQTPLSARSETWIYRLAHLPQGAPTSPALANLAAYRLDVRLEHLARRFEARYTRYADDLLFSGNDLLERGLKNLRLLVLAVALDEGFYIRSRKTRVMRDHHCQQAAGVVFNAQPNLARARYDQLKAILHNCVRYGPETQNSGQHANFQAHLRGRTAWVQMLNPSRGQKLMLLFEKIVWPS